jgi:CPA1 family monovalent cation:H+ antiporter
VGDFLATETLIILLLLVMALVAILARRVRLTYTVALVLVGLVIAIWKPVDIQVTPELILALLIPPLVFEGAFQIDLTLFRENLAAILTMAVPGVLLTAFIVGGVVTLTVGIPLAVSVVFGALIAATDPVAVIGAFRTMGAPRRLAVTMEGESLLNDGTAMVVYKIAVVAALSHVFRPASGVLDFLSVSLGGLAVGLVLGWLTAQLIARIDDPLIEVTLTTVLAYGSYLAAERLHVSGVLAVVAAGIVGGNVGLRGMSPSTRLMLYNFWEYAAFLANSFVFLLIGAQVDIPVLIHDWWPILVAVIAVLAARALAVYGLSWAARWLGKGLPPSWRSVLFWGGLRGAIALALALGLPETLPHREVLQAMTFGVVLFTLLVQGTTIPLLLRRVGLAEQSEATLERETRWGRLYSAQAAQRRLLQLHSEGMVVGDIWAGVSEEYKVTSRQLTAEVDQLYAEYPELEREVVMQARREALKAERTALRDALVRGWLSNQSYEVLVEEVDRRLEALRLIGELTAGAPTTPEGDAQKSTANC